VALFAQGEQGDARRLGNCFTLAVSYRTGQPDPHRIVPRRDAMALWDRFKESAQSMQTQLTAKKNDLKSGAFRDASMAMCALVAAADGSVDPAERQRVAALIGTNDVLQNFPALDLQRRFDDYLTKLTSDFDFGKVAILQEIAKVQKKPTEARAVIQIGIVIGGADGVFDKSEQAVVREACFAVGLNPAEFDL
jgi:tellurite resistance protein TerB